MKSSPTLEDLIGIEHCKLGFYQELQRKVAQLKTSNQELEKKRKEIQALLDGITDLMVVLSEDLKIQRVNHVFEQWFPGIDPIGRHCHDVFRKQDQCCEKCPKGGAERRLTRATLRTSQAVCSSSHAPLLPSRQQYVAHPVFVPPSLVAERSGQHHRSV